MLTKSKHKMNTRTHTHAGPPPYTHTHPPTHQKTKQSNTQNETQTYMYISYTVLFHSSWLNYKAGPQIETIEYFNPLFSLQLFKDHHWTVLVLQWNAAARMQILEQREQL